MSLDDQTILVLQAQQGIKTVTVEFHNFNAEPVPSYNSPHKPSSKGYTYKCAFPVETGDLLMVQARDWFQVVRVTEVHETPDYSDDRKIRWALMNLNDGEAYGEKLECSENEARRKLIQARAAKQAQEVLEAAGVTDTDNLLSLPAYEIEDAEVLDDAS